MAGERARPRANHRREQRASPGPARRSAERGGGDGDGDKRIVAPGQPGGSVGRDRYPSPHRRLCPSPFQRVCMCRPARRRPMGTGEILPKSLKIKPFFRWTKGNSSREAHRSPSSTFEPVPPMWPSPGPKPLGALSPRLHGSPRPARCPTLAPPQAPRAVPSRGPSRYTSFLGSYHTWSFWF